MKSSYVAFYLGVLNTEFIREKKRKIFKNRYNPRKYDFQVFFYGNLFV